MIEKNVVAHIAHGWGAEVNDAGDCSLTVGGMTTFMSEQELRRLWANIGTLLRESAKWHG